MQYRGIYKVVDYILCVLRSKKRNKWLNSLWRYRSVVERSLRLILCKDHPRIPRKNNGSSCRASFRDQTEALCGSHKFCCCNNNKRRICAKYNHFYSTCHQQSDLLWSLILSCYRVDNLNVIVRVAVNRAKVQEVAHRENVVLKAINEERGYRIPLDEWAMQSVTNLVRLLVRIERTSRLSGMSHMASLESNALCSFFRSKRPALLFHFSTSVL